MLSQALRFVREVRAVTSAPADISAVSGDLALCVSIAASVDAIDRSEVTSPFDCFDLYLYAPAICSLHCAFQLIANA